jgi:hypothetical protein
VSLVVHRRVYKDLNRKSYDCASRRRLSYSYFKADFIMKSMVFSPILYGGRLAYGLRLDSSMPSKPGTSERLQLLGET